MSNEELTTRQAAERLGESDRLVRLWCQQGRFSNAHLVEHPRGDYWLIPVSDLDNFVKPKPGPVPKPKASGTDGKVNVKTKAEKANRANRKRAISRWEGEGGALPPSKPSRKGKKK